MIATSRNTNREELLDIARVVACLSIMLFHFYSRHTTGIEAYPYGDSYDFFRYGYLGVPFFFMLSGYLILPSLQRASSLYSFLVKKIIRLWIPLVLCSVVTFIFVLLVDTDMIYASAHKLSNFIFSLLFIHPYWATTLTGHEFDYINGAYWFLSVEIIFIILSACIYYIDKIHFVRNFLLLSIVGHLVFYGIYYGGHRIITNYFCNNKLGIPFDADTMLVARDWLNNWTYPTNSISCLFGFIVYLWKDSLDRIVPLGRGTRAVLSVIWLLLYSVQCVLFKPSVLEIAIVLSICLCFAIYLSIYLSIGALHLQELQSSCVCWAKQLIQPI